MVNGQRIACLVNVPIGDLLPTPPLTSFGFRSVYYLARIISVVTLSYVPQNFRLARKFDISYNLTPSGLGLANSFYRAFCIHCTIANVTDAEKCTNGFAPRTSTDPYNLLQMSADTSKYVDARKAAEDDAAITIRGNPLQLRIATHDSESGAQSRTGSRVISGRVLRGHHVLACRICRAIAMERSSSWGKTVDVMGDLME
ncbi:hypothetical protein Q1695_015413 [Nippostrongylus brasiliensis]|nr:hypothetical protein Q1695_015413 [Nippostrongylus brasiliensis]